MCILGGGKTKGRKKREKCLGHRNILRILFKRESSEELCACVRVYSMASKLALLPLPGCE